MSRQYVATLPLLRRLLGAVGPYAWRQRRRLLLAYTCTALSIAALLLAPWPLKLIIDDLLVTRSVPGWAGDGLLQGVSLSVLLVGLALAAVLLAGARAQLVAWEARLNARIDEQLMLDLRQRALEHIQALAGRLRADHQQRSGELVLRIVDDVRFVSKLMTRALPQAVQFLLSAVFTLAVMTWMDPRLGLIAALITLAITVLATRFARPMRKAAQAKRKAEGQVAGFAQEAVRGLATTQMQSQEQPIRERFAGINRASVAAGVRQVRVVSGMERGLQLAKATAMAAITGGGGLLVLAGDISIGSLTVFIAYMTQLMRPVEKINSLANTVVKGLTRGEQLLDLLALRPAVENHPQARTLDRAVGEIEFREVSFSYPGADPARPRPAVLNQVSFRIPAGSRCALVGGSGAGKSTLVSLLLRLYDPDQGQVLLDGQPIDRVRLESLRRQFAVMTQDIHLLAGSIREVLGTGADPDPRPDPDTAAWRALEQVGLRATVEAMPLGLDTPLGECAANLSGGQRARLSLARVFLLDRPLIVLDEPTANVDEDSARIILEALDRLCEGRTCIVVSHQPEVIRWARMKLRVQAGQALAVAA